MMPRLMTTCVLSLASIAGLGCRCVSRAPAAPEKPSTRPATAGEAGGGLLTGPERIVLVRQMNWLKEEGVAHRGCAFGELTFAVDQLRQRNGLRVRDMLALLGPPEYGGETAKGGEFIFLYSCSDVPMFCVVYSQANAEVTRFGWNQRQAIDLSRYPKYSVYPR